MHKSVLSTQKGVLNPGFRLTVIWRHSFVDKLEKVFGCCLHGLLGRLHHQRLLGKLTMTHPQHKQTQRLQNEQFVDSSAEKIMSRESSLTPRTPEWLMW